MKKKHRQVRALLQAMKVCHQWPIVNMPPNTGKDSCPFLGYSAVTGKQNKTSKRGNIQPHNGKRPDNRKKGKVYVFTIQIQTLRITQWSALRSHSTPQAQEAKRTPERRHKSPPLKSALTSCTSQSVSCTWEENKLPCTDDNRDKKWRTIEQSTHAFTPLSGPFLFAFLLNLASSGNCNAMARSQRNYYQLSSVDMQAILLLSFGIGLCMHIIIMMQCEYTRVPTSTRLYLAHHWTPVPNLRYLRCKSGRQRVKDIHSAIHMYLISVYITFSTCTSLS